MIKNYFTVLLTVFIFFLGCQSEDITSWEANQKLYNISRFEKWLPQNSQILPTSAKIVEINDEIFTEYLI